MGGRGFHQLRFGRGISPERAFRHLYSDKTDSLYSEGPVFLNKTHMEVISIRGARTHNLKNISLTIPRGKLTVITGLSGSGKSSLAFDTLYAEGQRRYVESLSAYARQFLELMPRPDVDAVEGLSPAIAIDQKGASSNPRSTVGTMTEIADYMRLLFARAGVPHCPTHGQALSMDSIASMVDRTIALSRGARVMILAPAVTRKAGDFRSYFESRLAQGYMRFRIDGEVQVLDEPLSLDDGRSHNIEVVVDRLRISDDARTRLAESCQTAAELGGGRVCVEEMDSDMRYAFSTRYACPLCDYTVPRLEPALFSPNNPNGCCTHCGGTGRSADFDESLVAAAPELSLETGALAGWDARNPKKFKRLALLAEKEGFSVTTPWRDLPESARKTVLYGSEASRAMMPPFDGVMNEIRTLWNDSKTSAYLKEGLKAYRSETVCPVCRGLRLRRDVLSVLVGDGERRYTIGDMDGMSLAALRRVMETLEFDAQHQSVAVRLVSTIADRLRFLENVGLGYLTLGRRTDTLSGGEAQRIRLAGQIGSGLTGVMYVLDEPSIGLHQRDNDKLLASLRALRDLGNTLIVVEHDEDAIRSADYIVDMGPGAGEQGGTVIAAGTPAEIMAAGTSLTGRYLSGELAVPVPGRRHRPNHGWLTLSGATGHNLRNVTLRIPIGLLSVVTGVSGSGKSSLVIDTLYAAMAGLVNRAKMSPLPYASIDNAEAFDKVVMVDQSPIGRTPRSNPATYTGIFSEIREVFAQTQISRERGYGSGRFSFNVKGGRCEACQGDGVIRMEMHFLPDVYVPCEVCRGRRYNRETLEVKYHDLDIAQVLDLTVDEALPLFARYPKITRVLKALTAVGLGYIRLGQSATTFSGGEAQRIKLASELSRPENGRTLYILDEPTTGLHFHDVAQLMEVLRKLTGAGNTVLVIEHNLDVIKGADWVADMGPDGGAGGGLILCEGTPETIAKAGDKSVTGPYLARILKSTNVSGGRR